MRSSSWVSSSLDFIFSLSSLSSSSRSASSSSSLCISSQCLRSSLPICSSALARLTFSSSMASFVLRSSSWFFHSSLSLRICSFLETGSAMGDADQPWSSHGRVSLSALLRRSASACAASPSSRTYGVMNTRSSLRFSACETVPNSHLPIQGRSLSIGMPVSSSWVNVSVSPPNTTVCMFSSRMSADILRVRAVSMFSFPVPPLEPLTSTVCPAPSCEYSSSISSITVPFGLIFGVTLILMPMSLSE